MAARKTVRLRQPIPEEGFDWAGPLEHLLENLIESLATQRCDDEHHCRMAAVRRNQTPDDQCAQGHQHQLGAHASHLEHQEGKPRGSGCVYGAPYGAIEFVSSAAQYLCGQPAEERQGQRRGGESRDQRLLFALHSVSVEQACGLSSTPSAPLPPGTDHRSILLCEPKSSNRCARRDTLKRIADRLVAKERYAA